MYELFTLVLGIVGLFVVLSGASYFLEPSAMKKNGFFTTPPVISVKIIASLIGLLFLAMYILEILTSPFNHPLLLALAIMLFIYVFGAERLINVWENRKKN
jgi:hypothetical protein